MKIYNHVTTCLTLLGLLIGSTPVSLFAAPVDKDTKATSATLLCGGHHTYDEDATGAMVPTRISNWSFRNYNDSASIQIDRIRIYDAQGALIRDEMPPTASSNGVDPSNLGPHSTILFKSIHIFDPSNTPTYLPLQFVLDWSSVSGKKVLTLDGYVVRGNAWGGSAFTFDCRTVKSKKIKEN